MAGERLVKKIYRADVEDNRRRDQEEGGWMERKVARIIRGLTIPEAKKCVKDRRVETYC